jgi:hypothetical protein
MRLYKQVVLRCSPVFLLIMLLAALCGSRYAYAQKKTVDKKKATPQAKALVNAKPDTVIVIREDNKPAAPQPADVVTRSVQTVIIIDRATGKPKVKDSIKSTIRPIDTVIILKGYKKKTQEQEDEEDSKTAANDGIAKVVKVNENCQCVTLNMKASDTLRQDDYVNYQFLFKNNCKESVWISSSSFGFLVFLKNGTPARQLRKLDYVKRYNYPDFVQLSPGQEFTFMFGDDAFYQYDLHRGWEYKFSFTYYNNMKYRKAPAKTYMCSQFKDKMIFIK